MVSQSRGVPRPGCVFVVIHHMCSVPSSCVQRTLQATEHVWKPMHLFRSKTQASCRSDVTGGVLVMAAPPFLLRATLAWRCPVDPLDVHEHSAVRRDGLPVERTVLQVAVAAHQTQPLHNPRLYVRLAVPLAVHVRLEAVVDNDLSRTNAGRDLRRDEHRANVAEYAYGL